MHSKIRVLMQRLKLVFELRKGKKVYWNYYSKPKFGPCCLWQGGLDLFFSLFIWFQSLVYPSHYLFSLSLVISGRYDEWEAWKRNLMEKTCRKKNPSQRVVDG
jgi:hypothetical protein